MCDSNEINEIILDNLRKNVFLKMLRFISKMVADILSLCTNTRMAMEFTN